MIVEILSKHFSQRWRQRVGDVPSLEDVNEMLIRGYRLRNMRHLYSRRGGKLRPVKILAEYVDGIRGLLLRIDMERKTAVTVIALVPQGKHLSADDADGADENMSPCGREAVDQ